MKKTCPPLSHAVESVSSILAARFEPKLTGKAKIQIFPDELKFVVKENSFEIEPPDGFRRNSDGTPLDENENQDFAGAVSAEAAGNPSFVLNRAAASGGSPFSGSKSESRMRLRIFSSSGNWIRFSAPLMSCV